MQIKEFQSEENAGERIDKFLTEKVPELSRSYIQKLITIRLQREIRSGLRYRI